MANRSSTSTRYNLRSRAKREDVKITPQQILNTFYGAFFEPLIKSKTKEFSLDFLNEQNFNKKFPKHWKSLLRNESIDNPVKTYTILIENINFLTIKYFAGRVIERFIILEPSLLEKLKDEFDKTSSEQPSPSVAVEGKVMISIPLTRLQNKCAQNLRFQFIDNCKKKLFLTYVLPELNKPTLLLGNLFSLPEFKKALVDLDYVTNAVQRLKESKFVRKVSDDELSSDESNETLDKRPYRCNEESQPRLQEQINETLIESFQSLRPEKSDELRKKLALIQLDKLLPDSINSSNSTSSLMNTIISNSKQPVHLIFNINQGEGIQNVHVGQATPSDSVYVSNNTSRVQSPEKSRPDQSSPTQANSDYHLVCMKFSKLKIGILLTLVKYTQSVAIQEFYKTGKLDDVEECTGRISSTKISFTEYITDFGRKVLVQKYLAAFSTKDLETFRSKRGLVSSEDLEGRKIFMVHQNKDLDLNVAENFCIKIRNKNVKKYFELFEISKGNFGDTHKYQPFFTPRKQRQRFSSDSGYSDNFKLKEFNVSTPPTELLSDARQAANKIKPQLKEKIAANIELSKICQPSHPHPSTSSIKQNNIENKDIDDIEVESYMEVVEETDFAPSNLSPVVPFVAHAQACHQNDQELTQEATKLQKSKSPESRSKIHNSEIQTSDGENSSCTSPSYEDLISDQSSSDFYGFSDDSINNSKRGVKSKKKLTQRDLPLKKRYVLLKSRITKKARERHYTTTLRLNSAKNLKFSKNLNFLYYSDKNRKVIKTRRNSSASASRLLPIKQRVLRRIFSTSCERQSESLFMMTTNTNSGSFQKMGPLKQYKALHGCCPSTKRSTQKNKIQHNISDLNTKRNLQGPTTSANFAQRLPKFNETFLASSRASLKRSAFEINDVHKTNKTNELSGQQHDLLEKESQENSGLQQLILCASPSTERMNEVELPQEEQGENNEVKYGGFFMLNRENEDIIAISSDSDLENNCCNDAGNIVQNDNLSDELIKEVTREIKCETNTKSATQTVTVQQTKLKACKKKSINPYYFMDQNQRLGPSSNLFVNPYLANGENNYCQPSTSTIPAPEHNNELTLNCSTTPISGRPLQANERFAGNKTVRNSRPSNSGIELLNNNANGLQISAPEANLGVRPRMSQPPVSVPAFNYSTTESYFAQEAHQQTIVQNNYPGIYHSHAMQTNHAHINPVPSSLQDSNQLRSYQSDQFSQQWIPSTESTSAPNAQEQQLEQANYAFQNHGQQSTSYMPPEQFVNGGQRPAAPLQGLQRNQHQFVPNHQLMQSQPPASFNQPNNIFLTYPGTNNMLVQRYNDFLGQLQGLATETQMARYALIQNVTNPRVVIVFQQTGNNITVQPMCLEVTSTLPQTNYIPLVHYPYLSDNRRNHTSNNF